MKEDVIIVGAGIGGLCCGALLAHGGHKVTIYEKNPYLGGACSSYTKEGFTFDRGVHVFTSGLNGPYGQVMSRIGLDTLQFLENINAKTGIKFYKQDKIVPFNINVNDAFIMQTWNYLKKWYDLCWNSANGSLHYKRQQIGKMIVHISDRQGVVLRRVEFVNVQIKEIEGHSFSWKEDGIIEGGATFIADYWIDSYYDINTSN